MRCAGGRHKTVGERRCKTQTRPAEATSACQRAVRSRRAAMTEQHVSVTMSQDQSQMDEVKCGQRNQEVQVEDATAGTFHNEDEYEG